MVEDEQDALALEVKDPSNLAYVTQTTLSMDDTSAVIDALRRSSLKFRGHVKMISVMRHKTARMRLSS